MLSLESTAKRRYVGSQKEIEDFTCDAPSLSIPFFFNDTATTEIYTLSLHDALPISAIVSQRGEHTIPRLQIRHERRQTTAATRTAHNEQYEPYIRLHSTQHTAQRGIVCSPDRKSTRLNSSHQIISYALFCLKKNKIP